MHSQVDDAEAVGQQITLWNLRVKYSLLASERSWSENAGEALLTHLLSRSICCSFLYKIIFFEAETGVKL